MIMSYLLLVTIHEVLVLFVQIIFPYIFVSNVL